MVMQFKESWSNVDVISMSTSSTTNIGASATLSYESPETVCGSIGASATAERSIETSKAQENTFVIKKATFEVPYSHQLYKSSHNGKTYAVRTVGAETVLSGAVARPHL